MNEVKLTGAFERGIEMRRINRGDKDMDLATGSLTFTVKRGAQEVQQWIDVECVGDKAAEMEAIPKNVGVTIEGEIRRAAWKDKVTDEWKHRHFIYYRSHTPIEAAEATQEAFIADDIPF